MCVRATEIWPQTGSQRVGHGNAHRDRAAALMVNVSGNGTERLAKEGHTQAPSCSHSSYSPAKAILMAPFYLLKEALGLMTGTKGFLNSNPPGL